MPMLLPRRIDRALHRAIATVVAISLLTMPVTYRGGAEAAHAHTIFQLWEDVQSGSFTHHAAEDAPREPELTVGVEHAGMDHAPAPSDRHSGDVGGASGHRVRTDRGHAETGEPAGSSPTGTAALDVDEDAPVASSAFTPNVRDTTLVLPSTDPLGAAESFFSSPRRALRLDGIAESPVAPPPRQAA